MSTPDATDEQLRFLMRCAQDGDAAAYSALLTAITPRIRRAIRSRRSFLGAEAVEDLLQEVLLSIHAARSTYDPQRPFAPWLGALIRYRLADAARQHAKQGAHEVTVDDLDVTFEGRAANTEDGSVGDVEALAHAIRALPPGQRQAIEMLKLKEMSLKEASAATGLSVGALKLATHRAMTSLRRALGATGSDED